MPAETVPARSRMPSTSGTGFSGSGRVLADRGMEQIAVGKQPDYGVPVATGSLAPVLGAWYCVACRRSWKVIEYPAPEICSEIRNPCGDGSAWYHRDLCPWC